MLPRRLTLAGTAALLAAPRPAAADRLLGGVPLPDDVAVRPLQGGAGPAAGFSGAWIGSWDGSTRHLLVVEAVYPDQTAQVLYAIADGQGGRIRRRWMRRGATITGTTLQLEGQPSISYDIDPSGTLLGCYQQTGAPAYARMARIPPAALSGPEAGLDWAEPERLFLEGPKENGVPARLETVLFRPAGRGPGPFPLLVFHHGSTGSGDDPAIFGRTYWNYAIAEYFTARGWLVAFPQRRGRGRSEGLYDEGFAPDRAQGYSCDPAISLRGADRALADADAVVAALHRRPDVAPGPILTGGISRGGVLAIAFAGRHPDQVVGVLNFVGGWIGTGCGTAEEINGPLFRGGGLLPPAHSVDLRER